MPQKINFNFEISSAPSIVNHRSISIPEIPALRCIKSVFTSHFHPMPFSHFKSCSCCVGHACILSFVFSFHPDTSVLIGLSSGDVEVYFSIIDISYRSFLFQSTILLFSMFTKMIFSIHSWKIIL